MIVTNKYLDNSFGNPNAQPPTPTQTPTSAAFQSPTFQTPRNNSHTFSNHTGWTSTFAEEFSVFNATPGRLTSSHDPFSDISTPRPTTASSGTRVPSGTEEVEAEVSPHVHHLSSQSTLSLPPVDPPGQLSPSPHISSFHGRESEDKPKATLFKPRRRLEEAFSGQTATPPQSATKLTRKLAPKPPADIMQHDEQSFQHTLVTPGLPNLLTSASAADMFAYSMSAPVFSNSKPLWEPDTNMTGMDMDISFATDGSQLFDSSASHRVNTSFDWCRSNEIFQDSHDVPQFDNGGVESSKRKRPLAPKVSTSSTNHDTSTTAFGFASTSVAHDPLMMAASTGAVDPGLLFTLPEPTTSNVNDSKLNVSASSHSRPLAVVRRPYEHQQRELERDEERRRARIARDFSTGVRHDRTCFSSPAKKSSHPSAQQIISDSRPKTAVSQKTGQLTAVAPRLPMTERRATSSGGRVSPVKQNPISLGSIPETVPGTRTSVTFSIDANGRARAETKIIVEEPNTDRREPPCILNEECDSSNSGYSTDEEPIILPSRSTSFSLPQKRIDEPKLAQFDTSPQYTEGRRRSVCSIRKILGHGSQQDQGSESETAMENDDGSGNAANALRKVMKDRKQNTILSGSRQQVCYSKNTNKRPRNLSTPHNRQLYNNESSLSSLSPTTVSDPDLETPSTDPESTQSDGTRCVCHNRDSYGFMIQWSVPPPPLLLPS